MVGFRLLVLETIGRRLTIYFALGRPRCGGEGTSLHGFLDDITSHGTDGICDNSYMGAVIDLLGKYKLK